MNYRVRIQGMFLLIFICLFTATYGMNKVGTAGALFLRIPVGAEAVAMGSAYSGVVQNANATFWNPAALSFINARYDIRFHYSQWLVDLSHQSMAISLKLNSSITLSLGEVILVSPQMEITTTSRQNGTGETFGYYDVCLNFSAAKRFTDKFSMGGSLKLINQSVYTYSSRGIAFDVGTWYWTGFHDLRLIMVMRNFGPDMQFSGSFKDTRIKGNTLIQEKLSFGSYPLPLSFVMGIAQTLYSGNQYRLMVSMEGIYDNDYAERIHLGGKITYANSISLLLGYLVNYEQEGFTGGISIQSKRFQFSYAYKPMKSFSGISSFSLGLSR